MWDGIVSVLVAIVGIAALAVIFGKNSKTADVLSAGGGAFADALQAAEAPVLDNVMALRPHTGHGTY